MESQKTSAKADRKCDACRKAKQKCNPPNRTWDENTQEKCIRCTKAGDECGPNLTQFESDTTSRGKKRKARLSLDHGSTQSNWRARSDFGNPRPQSSSHDGPDTTEASSGKEPSFAAGDDNTKPESTPRVERYGSPVDANSMLETTHKLLWDYQYINHPKQTISFLEQDAPRQSDPALRQKDVATFLAWKIKDELAGVVRTVDVSHCSAEHVLLLVQEAVHRFRRLADDPEELLGVEYEVLDKRVHVGQRGTTSKGKQRDTVSLDYKGRLFHQLILERERNELICKIKSSSRSISPEAASTPSSDRSASSKRTMKQVGGLFFSRETANLLEDSSVTSHVSDYISSKSFAKNRRLRGRERMEFPALHTALLGQEPEARSWARWLESNVENVELVDFFKRTVAHVAAERGRVHLLNAVLRGHRKSLDTADAFGLTPLTIAVLHGHLPCCKLLIDAGFERHVRDPRGRNLLSIACRYRHLHVVEYLVNELRFPPYDDSGRYFCSPIHDAIESGNLQICAFLITSGADVYQDFNHKTPRELALEKGQTSILQLIDEKITRSVWSQPDVVSAHLGYQHGPSLQYNTGNGVGHLTSQQYVHDSQAHDTTSHYSSIPLYPTGDADTQYMDPSQLGLGWNGTLQP